jgi:pimeloyl-ACP methyl ester carboxylesterase
VPEIPIPEGRLHYLDDDFADPWRAHGTVLFQHGFCRNCNFWRAWIPSFGRHYRALRPDLRGCGQSHIDAESIDLISLDRLVDDVFLLLSRLSIQQVHLIGESLGGVVVAIAAARQPSLFKSLTLISTPRVVGAETRKVFAAGEEDWSAALRTLGLKEWWLRSRAAAGEMTGDQAMELHFAEEIGRTPVEVALVLSRLAAGLRLDDLLTSIQLPVLVLSPQLSRLTSPEDQAFITASIPNAEQVVVTGAHHGMYYQEADRLADMALRFVEGADRQAP